MTFLTE